MVKEADKRYNALGQEVVEDENGHFVPVDAEEGQSAEALFYEDHEKEYEAAGEDASNPVKERN